MEAKGGRAGCGLTAYLLLSPLAPHIYWHSHVCSRTLEKEGEANLYRKILFLNKGISNKAILNTMTSIRLAGEAINNLANRTREESERQKRIISYFEKEE